MHNVFRQKEEMMKKNDGKTVNQQYLFHGTDESLIEAISEQNFDWRVCGVHGTAYGKGTGGQLQQEHKACSTVYICCAVLCLLSEINQTTAAYFDLVVENKIFGLCHYEHFFVS